MALGTLGRVERIDPDSAKPVQKLQLRKSKTERAVDADGISAGPGGVWVTNGLTGGISRVNPVPKGTLNPDALWALGR